MDFIIAIIFGIVQGLTEFIPVSSSGHLLLLHTLFPSFRVENAVAFDLALHVGTLCAVVAVFWREIVRLARAVVRFGDPSLQEGRHTVGLILVATIPAGIVGVLFEEVIEQTLRSPWVVVTMLVVVALLFFWIERRTEHQKNINASSERLTRVRWKHALFIGFAQALALIPGTSRSGITIVAAMRAGLNRAAAARFSFLISIPIIAGAAITQLFEVAERGLNTSELRLFLLGTLSSSVIGYLAIRFLLQYLSHHSLRVFAVYRIVLAIGVSCLLVILML